MLTLKFYFTLLFVAVCFSCYNPQDCCEAPSICNVTDPVEDLPWLKEEIAQREKNKDDLYPYFYIQQGKFGKDYVFIYNNCCPACEALIPVYNCAGEKLFDLNDEIKINEDIVNVKIIWQPDGFDCQ